MEALCQDERCAWPRSRPAEAFRRLPFGITGFDIDLSPRPERPGEPEEFEFGRSDLAFRDTVHADVNDSGIEELREHNRRAAHYESEDFGCGTFRRRNASGVPMCRRHLLKSKAARDPACL